MATTHTSAGYTGSVDQASEARRFAISGGGRFRVASSTDWAVAVSTTATRTVTVGSGQAAACGVWDQTTDSDTLTLAANGGSQDRLDAIVATFNWSDRTVTFGVLQGTNLPPQVNTSTSVVDASRINRLPGLRYDALLAIIKVRPGVTTMASGDLSDCRLWGGWGNLQTPGTTNLAYLDLNPGDRVIVMGAAPTEYQREPDGSSRLIPRFYIASVAPTGTIPADSVWFQV